MTLDAFVADVFKAQRAIGTFLGVEPKGLRIPVGYDKDLKDLPLLIMQLKRIGLKYVSSDLRSSHSFEGKVTIERQPHTYANGLVEIPSVGLQDSSFTAEHALKYGTQHMSGPECIAHFLAVAEQVAALGDSVFAPLCLHPWAVMEYDPTLGHTRDFIRRARDLGHKFGTYGQIAHTFNPA